MPKFWYRLAFRLSLWYGGIMALSSLVCLVFIYLMMVSVLRNRTDAYLQGEASRCADILRSQGAEAMIAELNRENVATGTNDVFFHLWTVAGQPRVASDLSSWKDTNLNRPRALVQPGGPPAFEDWLGNSGHHDRLRVLTVALGSDWLLQLGITVSDDQRVIQASREILTAVMMGMVLFAVAVGWLMARRALSGVQAVTNTAKSISQGELDRRVPASGKGDEIDQLATTFNHMLERIQRLVEGMRQTNDNIAHELRSPITRIRGMSETTLTGNSSPLEYKQMAANTVEECDRLLAMINAMLDISEAETGLAKLKMENVDLAAIVRDAAELYEPVAEEKHIRVQVEASAPAHVRGDVQKLQRAVANLVDNAMKYSLDGGQVCLVVQGDGRVVRVLVSNDGPGISPGDLPHVFERFYRSLESLRQLGNGLGLSLAQAIVHAHQGAISVHSTPGVLTTFTMALPQIKG